MSTPLGIAASKVLFLLKMPFSPIGRRRIGPSTLIRLWPILFPLASLYRRHIVRSTHIVAVIGSLGKTTTARAISAVLGKSPTEVQGWNGRGFLARTVFRIGRGQRHAVIEVGVSRPGRMRRYRRLLRPELVVVTSIASEHHRTLGNLHDIRFEKSEMIRGLPPSSTVIANGDDPHVMWMVNHAPGQVITYGFGEANDVRAMGYQSLGLNGARFTLQADGRHYDVGCRLIGKHMVYPLLAAISVARVEGQDIGEVLERLEALSPTPRRLEPKLLSKELHLLMDDYKSVYESVESALNVLEALKVHHPMVVLGEVFESPMSDHETYSRIGCRIGRSVEYLVFVGSTERFDMLQASATREGLSPSCIRHAQRSVHKATAFIREALSEADTVLIKGFGKQRLERIYLLLDGVTVTCQRTTCEMPMIYSCETCPLVDR